jgi:hypothetical protein
MESGLTRIVEKRTYHEQVHSSRRVAFAPGVSRNWTSYRRARKKDERFTVSKPDRHRHRISVRPCPSIRCRSAELTSDLSPGVVFNSLRRFRLHHPKNSRWRGMPLRSANIISILRDSCNLEHRTPRGYSSPQHQTTLPAPAHGRQLAQVYRRVRHRQCNPCHKSTR